ncbi:hypothetical protein [Tropicimonas sp. S265A]|uniref:hypothetical protein n=1 Tax=Tropicimonas sp. S265A TaxID=3415134 RepID=UPI003C7DDDA4
MRIGFPNSLSRGAASSTGVFDPGTAAPVINGVPTISGVPLVGEVLMASPAPVAGFPPPVRSWQWLRSGVLVSGETGPSYVLSAADDGTAIAVQQVETNSTGGVTATSAPTDTIQIPPPPPPPPPLPSIWQISAGDAAATIASFPGAPTGTWDIAPGDGGATINSFPGA